ncbi:outer membrane lipid asymmetry maintenance protein MlaD [Luteimonas sp. RD2P54]|uniref:Outer membrane lipid asymmetry maintenance protein MlaD n=1 Tax=Luteimonas endophytica TaxID=3042023 RepID=A0ABT6J793_9GAMM|nr:outer membrane lipid asymmetry maintenance protein MlaD [Luteimonas endophytica]MDH5822681.1 outer membrane lipid asymmetry maintenance protein MlaD [Luteimonas endophytica]
MSSSRGPRLEFAVGAFLLLALGSLLVLAIASTNGRFGFSGDSYELTARFSNLGQLRRQAPVRVGGVTIGRVAGIELDPVRFDSIVTLAIDARYRDMPIDTSASILTGGLLGESYVDLQPGGDMESLQPGEEIAFTSPAVDLMQLVGRYMFSGPGAGNAAEPAAEGTTPDPLPSPEEPTP